MGSVPAIPDQATKDATTARIIAHVRHGWPHLDDVVVTFRGQFCYVALPGRRRARWRRPAPPSPVLRLRYQGHIDRWKIAIYKYSTESYTEAELPTSQHGTAGSRPLHPLGDLRGSSTLERMEPLPEGAGRHVQCCAVCWSDPSGDGHE